MSPIFSLYRHPWEATGSGDGKSIQKAMGKTSLGLWDVLLRESLQNSWDARSGSHIGFQVVDRNLSREETSFLLSELFGQYPPFGASRKLPKLVQRGQLPVLIISDSGTAGLGGPIRANIAPVPGERSDFADFVRNFGRDDEKGLAGGTYGYGKGVLYQASRVGMCLIYSQTRVDGRIENRLIGVSGGDGGYVDDGLKYTGRNWWGVIASDGIVDPLCGDTARNVAERSGVPVPAMDSTGTTIMILAPEEPNLSDDEHEAQLVSRAQILRNAAIKWSWPHALDMGGGPSVNFVFEQDDVRLPPIHPLTDSLIKHFAEAYVSVRSANEGAVEVSPMTKLFPVMSARPKKRLGTLAVRQARASISDDESLQNTVALMRSPRIVVKYLPVAAPPDEYALYSVFEAEADVDEDFASSEPVTHDDWIVKDALVRGNRNFVRIALKRIDEIFSGLYGTKADGTASKKAAGSTRISSILGSVIGGISGYGPSSQPPGSSGSGSAGGTSNPRRAQARLASPPKLLLIDETPHVLFSYEVQGGKSGELYALSAKAKVVTNTGGTEGDAPLAASQPELVGWIAEGEMLRVPILTVRTPMSEEILAVFTQPSDTAVTATVDIEMVGR